MTIGSVFAPSDIAIDAAGNVFVADGTILEIPHNFGTYGAPITIGSGFTDAQSVAVDLSDNVFVVDIGDGLCGISCEEHIAVPVAPAIKEIPFRSGSYSTPINLNLNIFGPGQLLVDAPRQPIRYRL